MPTEQKNREYVVQILNASGCGCPEKYVMMLKDTPDNKVISDLSPWAFDHDPESAIQFCSAALGRPVLPFAQAIGQDMIACFVVAPLDSPRVVVINPWSEDKESVLKVELDDYEAWLNYAAELSRSIHARAPDEDDD